MEIVKAANDWAKAEIVSAIIFMAFGLSYLLASLGFWQWGNTPLTKALIIPILIAGGLLLSAGIGFYLSNNTMLKTFEASYKADPSALIQSEKERTEKIMNTYRNVALKVFPAIAIVAALIFVFVSQPMVRAICIAVIAFFVVLILLDSQALKRMEIYHQQLELAEGKL